MGVLSGLRRWDFPAEAPSERGAVYAVTSFALYVTAYTAPLSLGAFLGYWYLGLSLVGCGLLLSL